MSKPLQMLVVENFGTCNLRCTYCFPEHLWQRQGHHGAMAEATYRALVERAFASTSEPGLDIHLAGGEPLLAGRAWLEMAFRTGREVAAAHGKRVTFSLQTNATHLTPDLARRLVEEGVNVGVSLDGPPEMNEAQRGHTGETLSGLEVLSEALGRRPGIIVTVTRCNATRMPEVVDYLDRLGVRLFRANQMGATASWNAHAAPHAGEWATARQDLLREVAARRGRMQEFNLSQTVGKFVGSLLGGVSPFQQGHSCCDARCSAGRQLLYFDQKGDAYPCPRANVTAGARIAHHADPDFDDRWDAALADLDRAMTVPDLCRACPAQLVCDYGCHAFNAAQGNFFEVNCDASKASFGFFAEHLEDVARVHLYGLWREELRAANAFSSLADGIDLPATLVRSLAGELARRLEARLALPDLRPELLTSRYGWREDLVPQATLRRRRVQSGARA